MEVWMHPVLFLDFAMWINPSFRVEVIQFCFDNMIAFRCSAGDYYKALGAAVNTIVPPNEMVGAMCKIAKGLNCVVFGIHARRERNEHGTEVEQKALYKLEEDIAMLINNEFITDFDGVIKYLQKLYLKRWGPKELNF
jgi:hypothetical protein